MARACEAVCPYQAPETVCRSQKAGQSSDNGINVTVPAATGSEVVADGAAAGTAGVDQEAGSDARAASVIFRRRSFGSCSKSPAQRACIASATSMPALSTAWRTWFHSATPKVAVAMPWRRRSEAAISRASPKPSLASASRARAATFHRGRAWPPQSVQATVRPARAVPHRRSAARRHRNPARGGRVRRRSASGSRAGPRTGRPQRDITDRRLTVQSSGRWSQGCAQVRADPTAPGDWPERGAENKSPVRAG